MLEAWKLKLQEQEIVFRQGSLEDLEQLTQTEGAAWPKEMAAPKKVIETRLKLNPQCTVVAENKTKSRIEGFIMTVPADSVEEFEATSWTEVASLAIDKNYLKDLSDPELEYCVTICARPDAPRGTATELVRAQAKISKALGRKVLRYGIRVPRFHEAYERGVSIFEYYQGLVDNEYHEDIYRVAKKAGGQAIGLLQNYYDDPASRNYGVLIDHDLEGTV